MPNISSTEHFEASPTVIIVCKTVGDVEGVNTLLNEMQISGSTPANIINLVNNYEKDNGIKAWDLLKSQRSLSNELDNFNKHPDIQIQTLIDEYHQDYFIEGHPGSNDTDNVTDVISIGVNSNNYESSRVTIPQKGSRRDPESGICSICIGVISCPDFTAAPTECSSAHGTYGVTECGHTFHSECLHKYFRISQKTECPNCRHPNIHKNISFFGNG